MTRAKTAWIMHIYEGLQCVWRVHALTEGDEGGEDDVTPLVLRN
jgi:hypothetical protein